MSPAQPPRWRRDAVVSFVTTVIVASVTYFFTVQAERQRQLVIGRQAEQLREASVAVVSVANQVASGGTPRTPCGVRPRWAWRT